MLFWAVTSGTCRREVRQSVTLLELKQSALVSFCSMLSDFLHISVIDWFFNLRKAYDTVAEAIVL